MTMDEKDEEMKVDNASQHGPTRDGCLSDGLSEPEMGDISSCQLTARIFFIFFLLALTSVLLTLVELYIGTVGVILVVLLALGLCCGCFCRYVYRLDYSASREGSGGRHGGGSNGLNGRHYSHTRHASHHCPLEAHHSATRYTACRRTYSGRAAGPMSRYGGATDEEKLDQIRAILTRELAGKAYPLHEATVPPSMALLASSKKSDAAAQQYILESHVVPIPSKYDDEHVALIIDQNSNGDLKTGVLARDRSLTL